MINRSVYFNNGVSIDNVLEIRLCKKTWEKITVVSEGSGKSFSWVVRYVLFRLIKRKSLQTRLNKGAFGDKFRSLDEIARGKKKMSKEQHRHKLCLYGSDEHFIRITSACLNVSMTHLVRIALEWHLDTLLERFTRLPRRGVSKKCFFCLAWYWLGIKRYSDVEFPIKSTQNFTVTLNRYPLYEYW